MTGSRFVIVGVLPILIALVGLLSVATPAAAHEHVIVGEYELTVGWRGEPAIAGVLNGLDLGIEHHFTNGTTAWVVGIENDLNASLATGPALTVKALEPQFSRPGWYTFDVIPTVAGAYSVRIAGRLNATTLVDATVNLNPVAQASDYQFPVTEPTATDLQNSIAQLNAQLAALQTLLTILIGVALLAVLIGAASLALTVRASRSMRRVP